MNRLTPLFERIFGDPRVMREWLSQLIMYSMTATLSGLYVDYFTLGQGLLKMVADIHGVPVSSADVELVKQGMLSMPAHPDVVSGLEALRSNGFPARHPHQFTAKSGRSKPPRAGRAR